MGGGAPSSLTGDSAPSTPAWGRLLGLHHSCSTTFWPTPLHVGPALSWATCASRSSFGSCHLQGGERTPWVACGQRGGAGGNLSKPFCRVSEPSGCWYHILLHGTPCVPGAAAAGERKLAARRSRLTQRSAEHRKQLTRGEGLVATCLFLSCCGGLFLFFPPCCSSFSHPGGVRAARFFQ